VAVKVEARLDIFTTEMGVIQHQFFLIFSARMTQWLCPTAARRARKHTLMGFDSPFFIKV
jgi:hypothetical protein